MKNSLVIAAFSCWVFACSEDVSMRDEPSGDHGQSLENAVAEFNAEAPPGRPIASIEPPLTVEEVVGVIKGWQRSERPPATDVMYQRFQRIAETKRIPTGAEFELKWIPSGRGTLQDEWCIDFSLRNEDDSGGYALRIRD